MDNLAYSEKMSRFRDLMSWFVSRFVQRSTVDLLFTHSPTIPSDSRNSDQIIIWLIEHLLKKPPCNQPVYPSKEWFNATILWLKPSQDVNELERMDLTSGHPTTYIQEYICNHMYTILCAYVYVYVYYVYAYVCVYVYVYVYVNVYVWMGGWMDGCMEVCSIHTCSYIDCHPCCLGFSTYGVKLAQQKGRFPLPNRPHLRPWPSEEFQPWTSKGQPP